MADAGGSKVTTIVSVPSDSQFAPTVQSDGQTAITANDSEFSEVKVSGSYILLASSMTNQDAWFGETNPRSNAYDGNFSNYWQGQVYDSNQIGKELFDFGSSASRKWRILIKYGGGGNNGNATYLLEYSIDNAAWTTYSSQVLNNNGSTVQTWLDVVTTAITARYWRLTVTSGGLSSQTVLVYDLVGLNLTSSVNPSVSLDSGSAQELLGVALYFDSLTDITSFKIESDENDDTNYRRRKTVPYSLITSDSYNIILIPRPAKQARRIKITGLDAGAKTMLIVKAKVYVFTESVINRRHRIISYDPTTSCTSLTGA